MRRQQGNVSTPLPQGGDMNGNDVEAIEKILAKGAAFHGFRQVTIGGGDESHVYADQLPTTESPELSGL